MTQLNIKKLEKSFGDQRILNDISFSIFHGNRIGIVGTNGCGKTTLLKIIAGIEEKDQGDLIYSWKNHIEFLRQDSSLESTTESSFQIEHEESKKRFQKLFHLDCQSTLLNPSGGEKTKLALSQILALDPDILLLDEPTNNLDFDGIQALIQILNAYNGTIITVSHDRYFLDQTIDRIIEIESGNSREFSGNYTNYKTEKAKLYAEQMHRYESGQRQQKKIEEAITQVKNWSDKAHRDSTKDVSGAPKMGAKEYKRVKAKKMDKKTKSQLKRLEKLKVSSEEKPLEEKDVYFQIQGNKNHGKRILQATDLGKNFGDRTLFKHSDFTIMRGEKVALFGSNGCGKSTLIQMILEQEPLNYGDIWISPTGNPFVLFQSFDDLPYSKTLLHYLGDLLGTVTGMHRTILNNMGLGKEHMHRQIKTLSFGEQMKLKLVEPILLGKDFIILDEPTNHLDLHAREMLEETLSGYQGTLLVVSHDIYFLQRVCNKVLLFEEKKIHRLEHSFKDYTMFIEG